MQREYGSKENVLPPHTILTNPTLLLRLCLDVSFQQCNQGYSLEVGYDWGPAGSQQRKESGMGGALSKLKSITQQSILSRPVLPHRPLTVTKES